MKSTTRCPKKLSRRRWKVTSTRSAKAIITSWLSECSSPGSHGLLARPKPHYSIWSGHRTPSTSGMTSWANTATNPSWIILNTTSVWRRRISSISTFASTVNCSRYKCAIFCRSLLSLTLRIRPRWKWPLKDLVFSLIRSKSSKDRTSRQ